MVKMKCLFMAMMLSALGGCAAFDLGVLNTLNASTAVRAKWSIAYGPSPRQTVDVYTPRREAGPRPVVVFFIGGRWTENDAHRFAFVGESLATHGVTAVVVDQRFYPEVKFPVFEQDGAKAIAWTKQHIAEFGGAPGRLFVMGYSSGAHTAAMLTLDDQYLAAVGGSPKEWIKGTIGIAGPYDFLPLEQDDLKAIFGPPEQEARSQPVNYVKPGAPPMLLLQGQADKNVNPRNAESLAEKLRAAGDSVRVIYYPGVDHYRIIGAMGRPVRRLAPTLRDVLSFVSGN